MYSSRYLVSMIDRYHTKKLTTTTTGEAQTQLTIKQSLSPLNRTVLKTLTIDTHTQTQSYKLTIIDDII